MSRRTSSLLNSIAAAAALALLAGAPPPALADSLAVVPPRGLGPYAVGCSNLTQDFSRLAPGESAVDYWEGQPDGNRPRYVINLLSDLNHSIYMSVPVPNDGALYGRYSGSGIDVVTLVCYPTSADNPRPGYTLPNGVTIPHMQQDGVSPLWPDQSQFPVLLFSHGLGGSPISGDYMEAIRIFASHGYVVVAPFHGDRRIIDTNLDNFSEIGYAILHFQDYVAMQSLRPLELRAALDAFLVNPDYRDHVDANRIGAFGASLGGESVLLMGGASLTTTIGMSSKPVLFDRRVKAAVGYVPYFGISIYPAFGRDQRGLDNVTLPFLAIAGTADTTAPIGPTRVGMQRLTNTRQLVALQGVQHGFNPAFSDDIFTWSLDFLDGQLSSDPTARARSARMTMVAGGGDDRLEQDYIAPSPAAVDQRIAIEFYNASLDHYFFTAEPAEAAMLDAGVVVPGWTRTGYDFKVWPAGDPRGLVACRFFGTPGVGPNSHFFTINADECAKVRNNPFWMFEGFAFNADFPANADCPADRVPIVRMYNNGKGGQANHRYLTSHAAIGNMLGQGWIIEGPVFCGLP